MPNHVYSEIRIHGSTLDVCAPLVLSEEGGVDFSVLLPLPLHFWPGSVGIEHEKHFVGTHLDAARNIWGTKWNAYGDPNMSSCGEDVLITMQTAWSIPTGWICALFNKLQLPMTVNWLDEGQEDAFSERYEWDGSFGPEWKQERHLSGSELHKRLHMVLWGCESFEEDA